MNPGKKPGVAAGVPVAAPVLMLGVPSREKGAMNDGKVGMGVVPVSGEVKNEVGSGPPVAGAPPNAAGSSKGAPPGVVAPAPNGNPAAAPPSVAAPVPKGNPAAAPPSVPAPKGKPAPAAAPPS
eukprot:scaffold651585_cov33-Prasinocladus_malaysianus.AAC.1